MEPTRNSYLDPYRYLISDDEFNKPLGIESTIKGFGQLSLSDRPSKINLEKMEVSKIRFTQASVSPSFSDGNKVTDLAQRLAKGEVSADDIPSIRVVRYKGQVWTLDNRRLRAFKDGFVDSVKVIIVDLKDKGIEKEFWDKKSNKSLEGGMVKNKCLDTTDRSHFEEGIYVFNKRVLNWTFEQIDQPMPSYKKVPLLDSYDDRKEYYESFEELIFEEARAILQTGIQRAHLQKKHPFQLSLIRLKIAKTAENPTEMRFSILSGLKSDVKAGDVFLLENAKHPEVCLIALASYSPSDQANFELSFKVVVSEDCTKTFSFLFEKNEKWNGTSLGSLITLQRMYDTCTSFSKKKETLLEKCILYGVSYRPDIDPQSIEGSTLNPSQKWAVESFLQLEEGLFLIQGPPGTGKTTTLIELLGELQKWGKRVLVCAPSNKAVHILAERFMQKFPDVPVILAGVEEKLPPNGPLNSIFMDLWCFQKVQFLQKMSENLLKLQPRKLIEGDFKFLKNRIEQASKDVESFNQDFFTFVEEIEKYKLSCMKDLDIKHSELLKALCAYYVIIESQNISAWEEGRIYYVRKETEGEMPEFIGSARSYLSTISSILSSLQQKLHSADIDESNTGLEGELLSHPQILFMTLSTSGQQRMKHIGSVDTLIVDEAGQAVEIETMIPMKANPKKCLLIGDIKQLPATVISQDAEKLKFGRSMMERLINDCNQPFAGLKTQYRMHPEISKWPSQKYYQNNLENHESVCKPEHAIKEMENSFSFLAPYAFINIDGKETSGLHGHGFLNDGEVKGVASIVNYLAQKHLINVEERVAIISFYAAQVNRIYEVLKGTYPKIKVNTVDGFQGGENDIIIISCVRANRQKQIGFLKESKRLNVALTRARFSLIILGNQPTLMRSDIAELVADADKRKLLFKEDVLQKLKGKETKIQAPKWSEPKELAITNRKTQLCRYYALSSSCPQKDRCNFAHGKGELYRTPKNSNSWHSSKK